MKTVTEKRFFQWYEDDISVTLRSRSGSYGNMKTKRVVCGLDSYNQTMSYEVMNPLRSSVGGDEKPMIIIIKDEDIDREEVL